MILEVVLSKRLWFLWQAFSRKHNKLGIDGVDAAGLVLAEAVPLSGQDFIMGFSAG
jgi:hypothetical protein